MWHYSSVKQKEKWRQINNTFGVLKKKCVQKGIGQKGEKKVERGFRDLLQGSREDLY